MENDPLPARLVPQQRRNHIPGVRKFVHHPDAVERRSSGQLLFFKIERLVKVIADQKRAQEQLHRQRAGVQTISAKKWRLGFWFCGSGGARPKVHARRRANNSFIFNKKDWCPGWESNPHEEKSPEDFKSSASAIPPPGRWLYKSNQHKRVLQHGCRFHGSRCWFSAATC